MFFIYIKIAFRILFKDRIFSLINILGLAIGMACFLLIGLYLKFEWEYDLFYPDSDRIYRVNTVGGITNVEDSTAKAPIFLAEKVLEDNSDLVESAGYAFEIWGSIIETDLHTDYEYDMFYTTSDFFKVFGIKPVLGNLDTALNSEHAVVISEAMAKKYFGNQNPIGKKMNIDVDDFPCTVTAVIGDVPQNSHIHYDLLLSANNLNKYISDEDWVYSIAYVYVKLREGIAPDALNDRFQALIKKYISPIMERRYNISAEEYQKDETFYFYLEPLSQLHLFSEVANNPFGTSHIKYFSLFGIAGLLILILTILNYINLSIARAIKRIKSISLRKAAGAGSWQLLLQFLVESLVMSFFAILLALSFLEFAIPYFMEITGKYFGNFIANNPLMYSYIIIWGLAIGLISGLYPAIHLSSVSIVKHIGGNAAFGQKKGFIRKFFVSMQFIISFVIIISSVVVYKQLQYIFTADIALEKEQIIVLNSAYMIGENKDGFKADLMKNETIEAISFSNIYPGPDCFFDELKVFHADTFNICTFSVLAGDYDLDRIFGFNVVQGRMPEDTVEGDSIAVVINETAVRKYMLKDPLNCFIEVKNALGEDIMVKVVGVVNDFHYENLHKEIGPLLIGKIAEINTRFCLIKAKSRATTETIEHIHRVWNEYTGDKYFHARTMDYNWEENYLEEKRTSDILLFFSIITIIVACIGLIGIVTYTSNSRLREIGIRKALGASNATIITMLMKEHVLLLLLAIVIAIPVAYVTVYSWLNSFAYKITLTPIYFTLPSIVLSVIVIGTVIIVSGKAATQEVAETIRYE